MQSQCLPAMVSMFGSADYGFVSVVPGMLNIYGKRGGMAVLVFLFPVCVWYSLTHVVLDPRSAVPGSQDASKFIIQNEIKTVLRKNVVP